MVSVEGPGALTLQSIETTFLSPLATSEALSGLREQLLFLFYLLAGSDIRGLSP